MRSISLSGVILVLAIRFAAAQDAPAIYLDLQPHSNQKLTQGLGSEGNNLASLPKGEQTLAGAKFKIGDGLIQLVGMAEPFLPEKVQGIKVGKTVKKLYILHACHHDSWEDAIVGYYTVNYDDNSQETIPIVYGKDMCDWWFFGDAKDARKPTRGKVAWTGTNDDTKNQGAGIRLFLTTWKNPQPERKVLSIDFGSTNYTFAAPFCVAITAEE